MRTRVKICGITRKEDALFCAREGVDALGFIFYKGSKRYVSPLEARKITRLLPPFINKVGVFVNAGRKEMIKTVKTANLDYVQLHGDEGQDVIDYLRNFVPVIRALRVRSQREIDSIKKIKADAYLLDTYSAGAFGGTGKNFSWELLKKMKTEKYIIVSGGITPYNIKKLFKFYAPYAVDCSSGVEKSAGIKDKKLIKLLFKNIHRYGTSR